MSYWTLFYHVVRATKDRQPLLSAEVEIEVFHLITSKATGLGAHVFALNGMPDHVHLVVSIPPSIAISKFVGQVKAVSAVRFNQNRMLDPRLRWQAEFAVFSLDKRRLKPHCDYVDRQKAHHGSNSIIPALENPGQPRGGAAP